MSIETLFRLIFALSMVFLFAMRLYHHAKAGTFREPVSTAIEGRWIGVFRWIAFLMLIFYPLGYLFAPHLIGWSLIDRPAWLGWIGVGLSILGLVGITWVNHTLGRHFSTTLIVRKEHEIVTGGPYRYARHPMYTTILAILVGWALLMGSWLVALMTALYVTLIMGVRTPREEAMLVAMFGDAYRAYMARTGRFWPVLRRSA
jgi:protein-S-isoprenylcysteine O-methyltransferase Ste14